MRKGRLLAAAVVAAFACSDQAVHAQQAGGIELEPAREAAPMSYAGLALAIVPDYMGSDDNTVGIAPVAKIHFGPNERYLKLLVTELSYNVLNNRTWNAGPVLNYRMGRDDVDNSQVDRMSDIDGALEAGVFGSWTWYGPADPRQRFTASLQFQHDISDEHEGYLISGGAKYFHPVSMPLTVSLGVSTTYGSEDYTQKYFGVSAADSAASGLRTFSADGGLRDVRLSPTVIYSLNPKWHLAGGLIYSRLLGDAADSPLVSDVGSKNQFMAGVGFAYVW